MCGFAGFSGGSHSTGLPRVVADMTAAISHRGPDDEGAWVDVGSGAGPSSPVNP